MIDSHAHLYFDRFDDDREAVLRRAREAGVEAVINVGIDVGTSHEAVEMSRADRSFYATIGLHPCSRLCDLEKQLGHVAELAREHPGRVVAIGETGLDYYWRDVSPEDQRPRFEQQLRLARELDLPVVLHCRDAFPDLLEILETRSQPPAGVCHCFSGGTDELARILRLGLYVSFAGNVTYPGQQKIREAALRTPLDRLLLETDAPFLPPQPKRGQRNEPSFLALSRDFLAELRGISPRELEAATTRNARRLFRLDRGGDSV